MFSISRSWLHALLKETVRNILAEIFHDKQGNHCMDTLFMAHAQIKPTGASKSDGQGEPAAKLVRDEPVEFEK
jgi:hypothetical protein